MHYNLMELMEELRCSFILENKINDIFFRVSFMNLCLFFCVIPVVYFSTGFFFFSFGSFFGRSSFLVDVFTVDVFTVDVFTVSSSLVDSFVDVFALSSFTGSLNGSSGTSLKFSLESLKRRTSISLSNL